MMMYVLKQNNYLKHSTPQHSTNKHVIKWQFPFYSYCSPSVENSTVFDTADFDFFYQNISELNSMQMIDMNILQVLICL